MPSKHEASLAAIRAKHGGKLPSAELCNMTNAELGKILYELTEEEKYIHGRIPKDELVQEILKISRNEEDGESEKDRDFIVHGHSKH